MHIQHSITLVSGVYKVEIRLADNPADGNALTGEETDALRKFGEMSVDAGGEFDDLEGLSYTLPNNVMSLPSQFPIAASFSLADNADAGDRADLFRNTILDRITIAHTALLAKTSVELGTQTLIL